MHSFWHFEKDLVVSVLLNASKDSALLLHVVKDILRIDKPPLEWRKLRLWNRLNNHSLHIVVFDYFVGLFLQNMINFIMIIIWDYNLSYHINDELDKKLQEHVKDDM